MPKNSKKVIIFTRNMCKNRLIQCPPNYIKITFSYPQAVNILSHHMWIRKNIFVVMEKISRFGTTATEILRLVFRIDIKPKIPHIFLSARIFFPHGY